MFTFSPNDINQRDLYRYLVNTIAPRPIAFVSTINKAGQINLAPFSYFTIASVKPTVLCFNPTLSGRTGKPKDTLVNVQEVPECVINIVPYSMVEQMNITSGNFDRGVDEFEKCGLSHAISQKVLPPRVYESPVQYECKIKDIITFGNEGGAGNLVLAEVQLIHINNDLVNDKGELTFDFLDLVGRLGGANYVRTYGDAVFKLEKAQGVKDLPLGFDNLPDDIKGSKLLTGNELGRLANYDHIPDKQTNFLDNSKDLDRMEVNRLNRLDKEERKRQLHLLAKKYINLGELAIAWQILLAD